MGNDVIHIPEHIEILPPEQMVQFREALATMEKLYLDLQPVFDEARALQAEVWDFSETGRARRARAGALVNIYKDVSKDAESTIKRFKDAVNQFKQKYILEPENKVLNRAAEIKAIITPKMADWDREDARQAQAEKNRIAREKQAELNRQAELKRQEDEKLAKALRDKRVAEIRADLKAGKFGNPKTPTAKRKAQKLLEEAGAVQEAALAKASADEDDAKEQAAKTAASVKVAPLAPKVAGNIKRVNYSAECTDKRGFLRALMAQKDVHSFERLAAVVEVSNSKLSDEARDRIKTSPDDTKHDLTVAQFENLYPFVTVKETRTY